VTIYIVFLILFATGNAWFAGTRRGWWEVNGVLAVLTAGLAVLLVLR